MRISEEDASDNDQGGSVVVKKASLVLTEFFRVGLELRALSFSRSASMKAR